MRTVHADGPYAIPNGELGPDGTLQHIAPPKFVLLQEEVRRKHVKAKLLPLEATEEVQR